MAGDTGLEVMQAELAAMEEQLRPILERRDWLRSLIKKAAARTNGTSAVPMQREAPKVDVAKPAPLEGQSVNDVILTYVKERSPRSIPRREIIQHVLDTKGTTSKNPRPMMYNYIRNLLEGGYLARTPSGDVVLGPERWNPKGREG